MKALLLVLSVPKRKTTYDASERKEDERKDEEKQKEEDQQVKIKKKQPGVDTEARYLKKAFKLHYGFKKHIRRMTREWLRPCIRPQPMSMIVKA